MPSRARAPRLPEQGGSSRPKDSSEGYEEEGLEGHREKLLSPAEQPGNGVLSIHSPPVGAAFGVSFLTIHAFINLPLKSFIHLMSTDNLISARH